MTLLIPRPRFPLRPLSLALSLWLMLGAGPALAQTAPPAAVSTPRAFTIPAQPLGDALNAWARQARLPIAAQQELVAGKTAPAVSGQLSPQQALDRLLTGSGLAGTVDGTGVVIRRAAASQAPGGRQLAEVTVSARGSQETATGPVRGFVAERSATATKTDTPLLETPQAISVVTADEVAARGGTITVSQALGYTAGFFSIDGSVNTRNEFGMLRGFSAYNSIYLDGLRVANGLDRAAARYEPYALERIEVIRGPSSVLYGQNAPGGLINTVSKRPVAETTREILLQVGSERHREAAFDLGGAWGERSEFQYRLVGLSRDSDTQVDFTRDDRRFLAPSFTWRPGADTRLTLLAHVQADRGPEPANQLPLYGTLRPSPFGTLPIGRSTSEPGKARYDRDQYSVGYEFEHRFNSALKIEQNYRHLNLKVDFYDLIFPGLREDGRTVDRTLYLFNETLKDDSVDTRLTADFSTGPVAHKLLLGVDYRRSATGSISGYHFNAGPPLDVFNPVYGAPIADLPANRPNTQSRRQAGFYLQDQLRLDRWLVTLGLRRDQARGDANYGGVAFENLKDSANTGRAALMYLFDSGFAPYVAYSESFDPVSGADFNNVPFKPTTGKQVEAGVKWQPAGSNSLVTLSAFSLRQQNVLTTDLQHADCDAFPDNCGYYSKQIGEVQSRGLELEGKTSLRNLDLSASYAYLNARYSRSDDGNQGLEIGAAPRHQAALWADYRFSGNNLKGLRLGGGVRYTGAFFGDEFQQIRNRAVTLFDAAIRYDLGLASPALRGTELAVNVNNLADKKYVYCASEARCTYGRTRSVLATLRYRW